ncbi:H(+)-transporting V1 sector ATPase subunit H [Recurvomyces mirabilis]|uniref:V-type proton ATPase subunit H n=1 Tax=Recurvomyces mirabilis TaxID=574656 RepID=A0AAE0WI25_9PEZI|nr:H(+)-transporting V1 sector ATPase subunit H [Recurvomyces mirabilis]KAK5159911.1 H(+)-transporting V1 sector ATPase subunit H [Recurvomyces mirabilis]
MSLDPPAYIQSLQNNIRARPISWEGAVRAKTITDADLKKIKAIDKVRKEQRKQVIESDTDTYTALLLGNGETKSIFEGAAKRTDILQYMLVLTGDLIEDIPALVDSLVNHPHPYKALLPLLKQSNNAEDPIPLLTSAVLSSLLSRALIAQPKSNPEIDEALPKIYTYISALSNTSDSNLQDIAVQEYSALLRTSKSRQQFWKQRKETLGPLVDVLRNATGGKDTDSTLYNGSAGTSIRSGAESTSKVGGGVGLQLLYHVLMAIWQLSFEGRLVGPGLDEDYDVIPLYIHLLRVSPKEKTTRLLLGTLYNLLSYNKSTLMPAALPAKLPSVLTNLKTRHFNDEDLLEDLDKLTQMMDEYTSSQTTFDEYASEVNSGHLRWSPPHKSADFWRENAKSIIENEQGALCKKLAEILSKDWANDKQVLAIGCNDVAFLVKECPEKRRALEKMGLKLRVMSLMQDENESVRWESLRAVGEWLRYSFDSQ